jgi:hypothetical protein
MKHRIAFILVFTLICQFSWAQDSTKPDIDSTQIESKEQIKNVFYAEVLGNAGGYSLNYERRLGGHWWARAGFSYISGSGDRFISFPFGVSNLFGKRRDFFELGLVVTPVYAEDDFSLDSENEDEEFGVIFSPTIGYRYQSKKEVFFKIAFTPLLTTFETTFTPWGGISLGYSF